jgi:hypothetical protein
LLGIPFIFNTYTNTKTKAGASINL